jgi:hypothetical protein
MAHLWTFEVFPDPARPELWWLNKRAYDVPDDLKIEKRAKRRKKK